MTPAQKLAALKRWADAIDTGSKHCDALDKAMGLSPESKTRAAFYDLMEALTKATAELVGDTMGNLDWYWMENDMGARGHTAGVVGDMREIRTLDDLLWLVEVME